MLNIFYFLDFKFVKFNADKNEIYQNETINTTFEIQATKGYNKYLVEEYLKLDFGYLILFESNDSDLEIVSKQNIQKSDYYFNFLNGTFQKLNSILNFRIKADYSVYYYETTFEGKIFYLGDKDVIVILENTINKAICKVRIYPGNSIITIKLEINFILPGFNKKIKEYKKKKYIIDCLSFNVPNHI